MHPHPNPKKTKTKSKSISGIERMAKGVVLFVRNSSMRYKMQCISGSGVLQSVHCMHGGGETPSVFRLKIESLFRNHQRRATRALSLSSEFTMCSVGGRCVHNEPLIFLSSLRLYAYAIHVYYVECMRSYVNWRARISIQSHEFSRGDFHTAFALQQRFAFNCFLPRTHTPVYRYFRLTAQSIPSTKSYTPFQIE